ncbi:MAG: pyruvate, phosphate dikinase [candidate division Zixibacteria bacterium]|nr:pyruvate, phosphate dikinase [candidate division Zixibacteria bacterium]
MDNQNKPKNDFIWFLQERAKELRCLYRIEEIINKTDVTIDEVCQGIAEAIPPGWQYPQVCEAKIEYEGKVYRSSEFEESPWFQSTKLIVQDKEVGEIKVLYTVEMPNADDGPFLNEEAQLLKTIAERLGHFIMYQNMKMVFHEYRAARREISERKEPEWRVALNLLKQTDKNLYLNISRRMLNHLCWSGIDEAEKIMQRFSFGIKAVPDTQFLDENRPHEKRVIAFSDEVCDEIFKLTDQHLLDENILFLIRRWIQEDKLSFLTRLINSNLPLFEAVDAIRRYCHLASKEMDLPRNTKRMVQISLIRRMLSDQIEYINTTNDVVDISDFRELLEHTIYPPDSHGKLGGKAAGLFLARQILRNTEQIDGFGEIKVPKTWYLASDGLLIFLQYNNLNEVVEQKYKDINQIRFEYPHIVQTFKNCQFPPEILQGLSMALDDLKDQPLIVRSSSLLEDRAGAAFSGKYKSLFLANQGTKQERLDALTDAIAEVYASIFGPDPIEYRAERGLLDFIEEMGIMIQEVVGTKVGDYFVPSFAGVAFSRNEFRWSPRIKHEDGLLRLVPGLGTRAVDRMGDDYPILVAPGQIGLRANVSVDEVIRYSPKKVDLINLKTNSFDTVDIDELIKKHGDEIPALAKMVSIFDGQQLRKPFASNIDTENDDLIVTFENLISNTKFVKEIKTILDLLEERIGRPVDIEFASDGKDFYLLQCRPQSHSEASMPAPIPKDIPEEKQLFTATRYISNGTVPDITHIVYVDPQAYDELTDYNQLVNIGRIVSKLNKLLPKRQFILMGPGRWGSRGDIKLGVQVTYSDINNTAVLIEIARQKGNYVPDLSFGTHFFQDLVEAEIRYLPLYPDDEGTYFNEKFFERAYNMLPDLLPEFADLAHVVKLIDIPKASERQTLRILMNAELDQALAYLAETDSEISDKKIGAESKEKIRTENYWAWRLRMAENIAALLDAERFGVEGFYVFGSTKNATAGPASDIDLLIHFRGTEKQREELMLWLEGWSLCLDEMNYLQTGYRTGGLLDVHLVTDKDIADKNSYAIKIGAVTDAARPMPTMKK